MISRLLRNHIGLYCFSVAPFRKIGREVVPELPNVQYPTKPKSQEEDERYSMKLVYETMNYLRKDRLPNCRYFALQYNNRIYRFYNAYYYPLGRMIDRVASQIRGRTSPHYKNNTADIKNGDVCVIVNIEDPLVTGKKLLFKKLMYHTGFVGHLREYSYKHVLNHKPELLYHFLLNKAMPKNKISKQYFQNLVLVRGPTHNFNQFPQFAPDKKQYSLLPQLNFQQFVQKDENLKLVSQSRPGVAEKLLKRTPDKYISERDQEQLNRQKEEVIEDLSRVHQDVPKYKQVPNITLREYNVMKGKQKKIEERYKPVRAPYKKASTNKNDNFKVYSSEKKARKDPNYELLKNEELEEMEDEEKMQSPLIMGGGVKKK